VFKKLISSFLFVSFLLSFPHDLLAFSQTYQPQEASMGFQRYFDTINLSPTWSEEIKVNKEVVVAVLDSGMDLDHIDLLSNVWVNSEEIAFNGQDDDNNSYVDDVNGWDFIDSDNSPQPNFSANYDRTAVNHGTVIAGIIAAAKNNLGLLGIAPQVKIMPLRILDDYGQGNTLVLSQAINYAVENGADVINLSLVGRAYDDVLKQAIENAYDRGVMIVAASGNEEVNGIDLNTDPRYPVCEVDEINRVLGVAALDSNKHLASFSNFGSKCIDISAPGENFYATVFHDARYSEFNQYYSSGWSGTSVAAPVVAATAALIKQQFPQFRPNEIYQIIKQSAKSLSANANSADLGAGLIDVGAALNLAQSQASATRNIILAPDKGLAPEIKILTDKGQEESKWLAYNVKFTGGVNLAIGDVNGDGIKEIITAPKAGGGPHVRIFNKDGVVLSEFMAYNAKFTGGVNLAIGDMDGDGKDEIITAPLSNGGPHVRIFDWQGNLRQQFFAYEDKFIGGVNLAVGDLDQDGSSEIVTSPASKYRPEIKTWNFSAQKLSDFLAYDAKMLDGVKISVGDVNADTWQEIVTAPAVNQKMDIKLFSPKGRAKGQFLAYNSQFKAGAELVVTDLSGDNWPEILTLAHKGSAAVLKVYDYLGLEKDSFYLSNSTDKNGYQFGILAYSL